MSLYNNKNADKLLEENRVLFDPEERRKKLESFQDVLIKDAPAVFLYSPDYIYIVSNKIKAVSVKKIAEPSERLTGIENWYARTRRVWK